MTGSIISVCTAQLTSIIAFSIPFTKYVTIETKFGNRLTKCVASGTEFSNTLTILLLLKPILVAHLWGWLGEAKVSCILRHRGVQLILAYSWARPAFLQQVMAGGGGGLFLLFYSFSFLPYPSLSSPLLSLFSLSLGEDTK